MLSEGFGGRGSLTEVWSKPECRAWRLLLATSSNTSLQLAPYEVASNNRQAWWLLLAASSNTCVTLVYCVAPYEVAINIRQANCPPRRSNAFDPSVLSQKAPYDVASNTRQALPGCSD